MKRIFKILLISLFLVICIGCEKNVSKVSYAKFNEYFSDKTDFKLINDTSSYDKNIRKYLEAGNSKYQIFFIEYDTEKNANVYMDSLKSEKNVKVTKYDKYTYAENTNDMYMVVYKVDSTIVIGKANETKYKNEINSILKDLGY